MSTARLIGWAALGVLGIAGNTPAAPITFNTALPVAAGNVVLREQLVLTRSGADPSGQGRDLAVNTILSVLGYGVSDKLALFAALPYKSKDLHSASGSGQLTRSSSGFGDLSLLGRYTLYQQDGPGETLRLAGFAGVEAPTGSHTGSDAQGRLPPSLQLGNGAWDALAGVVATWQTLDYQLDGQFAYRANGATAQFAAGDAWHLDGSLQSRLWPAALGSGVPGFLYGVLELNAVHQAKNRIDGRVDNHSGGSTVLLSPGIQYITKRWVWEAVLQKPVRQDLNGTALENDWILRTGFRHSF